MDVLEAYSDMRATSPLREQLYSRGGGCSRRSQRGDERHGADPPAGDRSMSLLNGEAAVPKYLARPCEVVGRACLERT